MKHIDFEKNYGKDTVSMWSIIGPPIKIVIAFILGLWALALYPDFRIWIDLTFDKSDQQKTGIFMLLIGGVSFAVLCWVAKKKI